MTIISILTRFGYSHTGQTGGNCRNRIPRAGLTEFHLVEAARNYRHGSKFTPLYFMPVSLYNLRTRNTIENSFNLSFGEICKMACHYTDLTKQYNQQSIGTGPLGPMLPPVSALCIARPPHFLG